METIKSNRTKKKTTVPKLKDHPAVHPCCTEKPRDPVEGYRGSDNTTLPRDIFQEDDTQVVHVHVENIEKQYYVT